MSLALRLMTDIKYKNFAQKMFTFFHPIAFTKLHIFSCVSMHSVWRIEYIKRKWKSYCVCVKFFYFSKRTLKASPQQTEALTFSTTPPSFVDE